MSKPTPGPWTLDKDSYTIESGGLIIASVCTVDDYSGLEEECKPQFAAECAANGNLLAAAPDLYAACEAILAWSSAEDFPDGWGTALDAAEAALRKARGEAL